MAEVKVIVKSVDQGSKDVQGFGKSLAGVVDKAKLAGAAVAAAGITFKKAFDLSKEGASLNQLTDSFNLMNESVFKTPDLLEQMSAAARGTIKETDLMAGLLKLTAGASTDLAQRFAEAAPQLLEISKASNKLNPQLGDTAFLYDSIATGIKRASPLILDNLGIVVKVGEANEKYAAELGKTVEALTAEEKQIALLNATMEAGGKLIEQVGGNVDSQVDAWARLEVMVTENTDRFKQFLADGLLPVVSAMAGDYGKAAEEVAQKTLAITESEEDLISSLSGANDAYELSRTALGRMTGTTDEATAANVNLALKLAAVTGDAEEYQAALSAAGMDVLKIRRLVEESGMGFILQGVALADTAQALVDYATASKEAADADRLFANYVNENTPALERTSDAAEDLSDKYAQMANIQERVIPPGEKYYDIHVKTTEAMKAEAEATKALNSASGDYFTNANKGESDLAKALQSTGERTVFVSNLTGQQADDLSRMQAAYEKAGSTIRDYELGLKGANLAEDARNKKIEEQAGIMATLQENMQPLIDAGGQYVTVTDDGAAMTSALNDMLYDAADAAGAGAEQLALLAFATGDYSEEQLNAALQTAAMTAMVEGLAQQLADGEITVRQAQTALEEFSQNYEATALIDVQDSDLRETLRKLAAFDGRTYRAKAIVESSGEIPQPGGSGKTGDPNKGGGKAIGGPVMPGGTYQVGENNRPELLQTPGGLYLIPGDRGQVFNNQQSQGMMGGGVTIQNLNITVGNSGGNGRMLGNQIAGAVAQNLGELY